MAVACGTCVANIYYNQPLLALLERAFAGQSAVVEWVPTMTQLGYAAGLICLVPLGDRMERRRLIVAQIICFNACAGPARARTQRGRAGRGLGTGRHHRVRCTTDRTARGGIG
ncbi:hypothetical protein GCM10010872_32330 [Dyella flava]|nr:hypothetical protein GCM10010872_32330 [Dyella flava]